MPTLDLEGRTIQYSIVKGASRRYTYFRFRPDLTLEVVIPRGRPIDVDTMLRDRLPWVRREYERAAGTRRILTDDSIMLGGAQFKLVFRQSASEEMVFYPERNEVEIRADRRGVARELVRRFFLKETSAYVVKKTAELAPALGVRPTRVDAREIAKWGYCTRSGRLSFSWQLFALPERLREYVVLHELVHLVYFDHSKAFKRLLESACPDFRSREKELDRVVPYDRLAPP